jgi:hypothetical protein
MCCCFWSTSRVAVCVCACHLINFNMYICEMTLGCLWWLSKKQHITPGCYCAEYQILLFFIFRSPSFRKWVHVFPWERRSSGLPGCCLSSRTRLRRPLLQPVCITIWFNNTCHWWGGKVSAQCVMTENSWCSVTVAGRCLHLVVSSSHVLISWLAHDIVCWWVWGYSSCNIRLHEIQKFT